MRWLIRILLGLLALVLLAALAVGGVFIALNTAAGRAFATREINHFGQGLVHIQGLAGHFPADIKLTGFSVLDKNGAYLTGQQAELRWIPQDLLHKSLHVTSLTATRIDLARAPVASSQQSQGGNGYNFPGWHAALDHLDIGHLTLPASLAGEPVDLHVTGATHLRDTTHGDITLDATPQSGDAAYHLAAKIDPDQVGLNLHINEPPNGLIGHFSGPQVQLPLTVDIVLSGPRAHAGLQAAVNLGAAQMNMAGTLGLDPSHPFGDVTLTIPALAPFATLAKQSLAGDTQLHLVVTPTNGDSGATLALQGHVALTQAPGFAQKLLAGRTDLSLLASLQGRQVTLSQLDLNGPQVSLSANGTVDGNQTVDLFTQATLKDVATLSPTLSGAVTENSHVAGTPQDFSLDATVSGNATAKGVPSGPFSIALDAQHLPKTPSGTLTGSGALAGAPLLLDAQFSRAEDGAASLLIHNALWKSLKAQANLSLAAGAKLPTGTANFSVGSLADFAPFAPIRLTGAAQGDFSYLGGQDFKLNLTARNLVAVPALGAINGTIKANGSVDALAVQAQITLAKLLNSAARLALTGTLDITDQRAHIATLSAGWRTLSTQLRGPADISLKPAITARHVNLALDGGSVSLDGTLYPQLNARAAVQNLPVSLAKTFMPDLAATGSISATANVTGTPEAPGGTFTLDARNLHDATGTAAAIPPANLSGSGSLAGQTATLNLKLAAGPNIAFTAQGTAPIKMTAPMNLRLAGKLDLKLLDPILAVQGSVVRGVIDTNLTATGTPQAPRANGSVTLADGSLQNIATGLSLNHINARIEAAGQRITLASLRATAGQGSFGGHGSLDLGSPSWPINLTITADKATPISSDLATETLDADLRVSGGLKSKMTLGGSLTLDKANINIPKSLPPSVANLPIVNAGAPPPPPPGPPPPPIALALDIRAKNQIFIRGDGLFAELGGHVHVGGTASNPDPSGGFTLIRGNFSLAGKTLQFTSGTIDFNGAGFIPALDLEASTTTSTNGTATLIIGGTAASPKISLTSSPPLPSDEILAQLLFSESTTSLTPFQAASLAAALAQLSGLGGGFSPLDKVRSALGLDELSLSGSGTGAPSVQAGRYVAPGVYVGATQATNGSGTQANVQINLYKGLKLETSTGTDSTGENASSVGLTYQFNY